MLEIVEKLLELQELDRQILQHSSRLERIPPERKSLIFKASDSGKELEEAKLAAHQLESRRKELELEAESEQAKIGRYSEQQLQTRKNEEYRALTSEIEGCRRRISDLEDRQLELMEEADRAQERIERAERTATQTRELADQEAVRLDQHEQELKERLQGLQHERSQRSCHVEPSVLTRYERLLRNRGDQSLVGVDRGNCGGCHVRLPPQIVISCKEQKAIIDCPNCGRMLYYAEGMLMRPAD